jgi:hypothetical protein
MATVNDEYIKSNMSGTLYKCERHNIVGKKNGDADEKEVYRLNEMNGHPGTIRNKYTCPGCNRPIYNTKERLKNFFTTSSKEAYDGQARRAEEKNKANAEKAKDAAEKAKLRPVYKNQFERYSPKIMGSVAAARRAGWMPFEEWFAKKKAGKPLYSQSELTAAVVDALQRENHRSSVRQDDKKEAVTPPRGAGAAAAAPQKQHQRPKPAGKKKPRRLSLNWEPSDQKKAEDPPPQNQQRKFLKF